MKILSDKSFKAEIEAATAAREAEVKGYYAAQMGEQNKYIEALAKQIRGLLQFAPVNPIDRGAIRRAYETNAVLKGIVDMIARAVGEVMPYVELTNRKSGKVDDKHPLNTLLARPNDRYSLTDIGEAAYINYGLFGDTWAYMPHGVGLNAGKFPELYVIPSWRIATEAGDWSQLFQDVRLADYPSAVINADEVFEVFDYNLDDKSFFGTSRVAAAALYLSVIEKGMKRQDTSLQNGGPANLITPAPTEMPALAEDKDSAEQRLNAQKSINKNLFMRLPVDVHPLGDKPVDLNILTSHKEAVTALCFVFGIPVDLYYGQSKYENAREAKKQLYEQNAIPFVNKWCRSLLNYAKLGTDYELKVNTDDIDILHDNPYDVAVKMNQVQAFSTNEIREAMGYEPIAEPWGDEIRLGLGTQIGNEPTDISEI